MLQDQLPKCSLLRDIRGAGKSTVLRALEDIGFFCIDNLPVQLLPSLFHLISQAHTMGQNVALGIDVRSGQNIEYLIQMLNSVQDDRIQKIKIFFLTARSEILYKRFNETKRKHPLGDALDLVTAIEQEKKLLVPLRECADIILETDQFNIHQLRNFVRISFCQGGAKLIVNLLSFGFKYGIPQESNVIYDVRFLPNPYFVSDLRGFNGTQTEIHTYLFSQHVVQEYWEKLHDFFNYSIQKFYEEGRSFVTIAFGCTGGRHRSVALVHKISQHVLENTQFIVKHRDINQDAYG